MGEGWIPPLGTMSLPALLKAHSKVTWWKLSSPTKSDGPDEVVRRRLAKGDTRAGFAASATGQSIGANASA